MLVSIASMARLQLPKSRISVSPANSALLAALWILGGYAWIPALLGHISFSFYDRKQGGSNRFLFLCFRLLIIISAAFIYKASGGVSPFGSLEPGHILPLALSGAFIICLNHEDLFHQLAPSGPRVRIDPISRLLDLAFVPLSLLTVILWTRWNAFYLVLIIFPLLMSFLFLRRAFRNFEEKDDLGIFYRFTERIKSSLNIEEVLSLAADELMEAAGVEGCSLALYDEESNDFLLCISRGALERCDLSLMRSLKDSIIPRISNLTASEVAEREGSSLYEALALSEGKLCITPMREEKTLTGFIISLKPEFVPKDQQYLAIVASQATSAILNADLYRKALQANEELKAAQAQLIQSSKMAALGQLVAGIAHELNNPLGAVLTNFQTLPRYLDEGLLPSLSDAEKSVIECKTIIEKLLRYSRMADESDHKMDLRAIIIDTMEIMRDQFALEHIKISEDLQETLPVKGNPNYIAQVLTNMLMNSYEALLRTAKEEKLIEVRTFSESSWSCFSVRDNGSGIPEEVKAQIFNPFFSTKPAGKSAGLGLSISRDIIERAGGTIDMNTKIDEYTLFSVKLPVYKD